MVPPTQALTDTGETATETAHTGGTHHLALELTGRCQLACAHCYAESSPLGDHGSMTVGDWRRVIDEGVALGVTSVQFIGGEPTLHPHCAELVEYALNAGLKVELYSNLLRIDDIWWDHLFHHPRLTVATSYYTAASDRHDLLTGRRGSHTRTRNNIVRALDAGARLRVGVVDMGGGEADSACADLRSLGVQTIRVGRLQSVGRAARAERSPTAPTSAEPALTELCGGCTRGQVAIDPRGDVTPCVIARWLRVGNVGETSLADVLSGPRMVAVTAELDAAFDGPAFVCDSGSSDCGP
ncbi:radical SAM protein [Streptomyces phytophilus]|uniref:radical SAM protein n=1 Tax=Streptomyces phytophilus TaxID=722715 RepID=UPI0015F0AD74|nr:radical SAM protein [Streptomyces phytophilus]